jgi:ferredoxin like protein
MKIEEKLALDAMKNDKESHIKLDRALCEKCREKYCILVCPGHLYSVNEETKEVVVEYAGCLECGTCSIACVRHAITWEYPKGEYGVQYRCG